MQNAISEEDNQQLIGERRRSVGGGAEQGVVEASCRGPALQLVGRTHCDRIVVFDGDARQIGEILPVRILDASAHTLFGHPVVRGRAVRLGAADLINRRLGKAIQISDASNRMPLATLPDN